MAVGVKRMAFVVLKDTGAAGPELAEALKAHVKTRLAVCKYPRWIEFVSDLPKTATGKIQRYTLRASLTAASSAPGVPPTRT